MTRTVILIITFCYFNSQANELPKRKNDSTVDSVEISVEYLKYFLERQNDWKPRNSELLKSLRGLVHFVEDEKIDTILYKLKTYRESHDGDFFYRLPTRVADSLDVEGYVPYADVREQLNQLERSIQSTIVKEQIAVPEELFVDMDKKVKLIAAGEKEVLLIDSLVTLPDSLKGFDALPDSVVRTPDDFRRLQRLDSAKNAFLETARLQYNSNLLQAYVDSVSEAYQNQYVQDYIRRAKFNFQDSIKTQNYRVLERYNNRVMESVNDSIAHMIDVLTNYAEKDSVEVWVKNSEGDSTRVWLRNDASRYSRMESEFRIRRKTACKFLLMMR